MNACALRSTASTMRMPPLQSVTTPSDHPYHASGLGSGMWPRSECRAASVFVDRLGRAVHTWGKTSMTQSSYEIIARNRPCSDSRPPRRGGRACTQGRRHGPSAHPRHAPPLGGGAWPSSLCRGASEIAARLGRAVHTSGPSTAQ
jgi:hypothetical protein